MLRHYAYAIDAIAPCRYFHMLLVCRQISLMPPELRRRHAIIRSSPCLDITVTFTGNEQLVTD